MSKQTCTKSDQHEKLHMCSLKGKEMSPEIQKLFSDPKFVCANCGFRVNKAENVCNPKPF